MKDWYNFKFQFFEKNYCLPMNLRRANENNFYAVYFRSLINLEINAAFYYITRLVGRIIQINIEF